MSSVDPPEEEKMDIDEDTQTPHLYPDLNTIQRKYAQQTPPAGAAGSLSEQNLVSPEKLPASDAIITQPGRVQGELRSLPEVFGFTNTQQVSSSVLSDTVTAHTNPQQPHKSADSPEDDLDIYTEHVAGAEGNDGQHTDDAAKHNDPAKLLASKSDAQDSNRSADSGGAKPSAPPDSVKVNIRVEWTQQIPDRWEKHLQKALQSWSNSKLSEHVKESCSVENLQLLDDPCYAVVEINPSKALDHLKILKNGTLTFKDLKINTTVHFLVNETKSLKEPPKSVSTAVEEKVPLSEVDLSFKAFMNLDKLHPNMQTELRNRFGNPPFGNSLSFSGSFDMIEKFYREVCGIIRGSETGMAAAAAMRNDLDRAEIPQHAERSGAPPPFTIPLFQYWYFSHVFRNELSQFEEAFGVKIKADVSVSVTAVDQTKSDNVQEAAQRFTDFYQQSTQNLQSVNIPQTQLKSEILKEVVHYVQIDKTKMMLDLSADQCLLFGPEQFISRVEKDMKLESRSVLPRSHSNDMTSKMETDTSRSWTLGMDIRDTLDPIMMNETHYELMKKTSQKQIHDIEQKYGVLFSAVPSQGSIKVTVQSNNQRINLESHAFRVFTHLYQKVATSAVACTFKNPADVKTVAQALETVGCQDRFVSVQEKNNIQQLVGLPKHLGPAVANIEKLAGKSVFDDKAKRLVGYPGNLPLSWGLRGGQQGAGAAGWTHGPVERMQMMNSGAHANNEPGKAANEKERDKSKDDNCPICMDNFTDKQKMKCGHEFCKECLEASVKHMGEICPVCKDIFGMLTGTQPDGKMSVSKLGSSLPGYSHCGTIQITYEIPDGIQTDRHPNPGRHYRGAYRTAYLPDNDEGRHVLQLLRRAFDQRLIFTVGTSTTTGADNSVIWNDIHHKTQVVGGPSCYGYPDPDYLNRVKEELKAKGIK